jgi:hypothetical protein
VSCASSNRGWLIVDRIRAEVVAEGVATCSTVKPVRPGFSPKTLPSRVLCFDEIGGFSGRLFNYEVTVVALDHSLDVRDLVAGLDRESPPAPTNSFVLLVRQEDGLVAIFASTFANEGRRALGQLRPRMCDAFVDHAKAGLVLGDSPFSRAHVDVRGSVATAISAALLRFSTISNRSVRSITMPST